MVNTMWLHDVMEVRRGYDIIIVNESKNAMMSVNGKDLKKCFARVKELLFPASGIIVSDSDFKAIAKKLAA